MAGITGVAEMGLSLLMLVLAVLLRKYFDLLSKNCIVKKLPDLEVLGISLDHGIISGPFTSIGRVSLILHREKKLENRNILCIVRVLHVDKI